MLKPVYLLQWAHRSPLCTHRFSVWRAPLSLCASSWCGPVPSCVSGAWSARPSHEFLGGLALNTIANYPSTVISGSGSTSRCNQLCEEDRQRRYKVGNDDACAVCISLFY